MIHFDSFAFPELYFKKHIRQSEKMHNSKIPRHIAIIMDGNGRWAQKVGKQRTFGHENGVLPVKEALEGAIEKGVKYLTLYAFSMENWGRPKEEIEALMSLLVSSVDKEMPTLIKHGIKLSVVGETAHLDKEVLLRLQSAVDKTADCDVLHLIVALSYSGRWDILQAVRKIAGQVASQSLSLQEINESAISQALSTAGIPDPELLIRTSGELRISNFLLWQMAYTELYFTPVLWPDFRKEHLFEAIAEYSRRERRFGKTEEQMIIN